MDYENQFKILRQSKRYKDINIKNTILKYAQQLALDQYTSYHYASYLNTPFEFVKKQHQKQLDEDYIKGLNRNISNRRYAQKDRVRPLKNVQIIMDYEFPLK